MVLVLVLVLMPVLLLLLLHFIMDAGCEGADILSGRPCLIAAPPLNMTSRRHRLPVAVAVNLSVGFCLLCNTLVHPELMASRSGLPPA